MFGTREVPCDRNHTSWEQFRDTAVRHFPEILNPDDYVLFSLRSRIQSGNDPIAGSLRAIHALNLVRREDFDPSTFYRIDLRSLQPQSFPELLPQVDQRVPEESISSGPQPRAQKQRSNRNKRVSAQEQDLRTRISTVGPDTQTATLTSIREEPTPRVRRATATVTRADQIEPVLPPEYTNDNRPQQTFRSGDSSQSREIYRSTNVIEYSEPDSPDGRYNRFQTERQESQSQRNRRTQKDNTRGLRISNESRARQPQDQSRRRRQYYRREDRDNNNRRY